MKKTLIIFGTILSLIIPSITVAAPIDFSGGVANEYEYEEIVFITGEPIKFVGKPKITQRDRNNSSTVSYSMKLSPHPDYKERYGDSSYSKSVSYETEYSDHSIIGQTTARTVVSKYSESIKIEDSEEEISYDLEDYQFSKSDAIDNRAASDFYSGDITGRKYYEVSGSDDIEGRVIVDITGTNSGYENFWGITETQNVDQVISSSISEGEGERPKNWTGTVNIKASDSLTKKLQYSKNDAQHSSFEGGYARVTQEESVSRHSYNLPGGSGSIALNAQKVPELERLIVPKFRDVNGHWAEDDIKKLYSLDVFGGSENIFSPNTPMNRLDFTKAVVKSSDIRDSDDGKRKPRRNSREESPFKDIATDHKDYAYAKRSLEKGIVKGSQDAFGARYFNPTDNLTRVEAITILMRALGFENRAPNPGYVTSFSDDAKIPYWGKDSIYMAKQINLIQGDTSNRVNPGKQLSRAEASTLLIRFLEFLESDLKQDYRENIVNFN